MSQGITRRGTTRQVFTDTRTTAMKATIRGTNISSTIDAFTIPSPTIKATITALVIDITSGGLATGIATSPDGSMHLADLAVCPGLCLPIGYGVLVFSLGRRAGSH